MKSGKSSTHDRLNIKKPRIPTSRSQSAIPNTKKSTTSVFYQKNFAALQNYNHIFGQKHSVHIGDADTHFRKSLRNYTEFFTPQNTAWVKCKEDNYPCKQHNFKRPIREPPRKEPIRVQKKEVLKNKEGGDSYVSELESIYFSDGGSITTPKSRTTLSSRVSIKSSRVSHQSSRGSLKSSLISVKSSHLLLKSNRSGVISGIASGSSFLLNSITESSATEEMAEDGDIDTDLEEIPEPEPEVEAEAEAADAKGKKTPKSQDSESVKDEDFKTLLDKSLQELQEAAEELDAEALEELTEHIENKIVEMEGMTANEANEQQDGPTGDARAIVPIDNKVLLELEEAELQARNTANVINELKAAVAALVNKDHMTEAEAKQLEEMNKQLVQHMEDFEAKTKLIQILVKFADEHLKPPPELPAIQEKQPEDMLPKVIICGTTENNMPKIIICDAEKKKKRPSSGKKSTGDGTPQYAKRLSESYDMQEKLAADNVDLEGKRYQLQEELLTKDKTCENLQRKLCNLQAEMRILAKENTVLSERIIKVQPKCRLRPDLPCGSGRGVCPADVENRLHHYSKTTSALEKHVEFMEAEVHRLQEELAVVQRERQELENQRKAAVEQAKKNAQQAAAGNVCRPTCHGPCRPGAMVEQQLRELREQYNRLQDDYKAKVTEVAGLRADNETLRCANREIENAKRANEARLENLEQERRRHDEETNKLIGSKEALIEQEQQLVVAKQRFREAQDELEETRALIGDQAAQLDDYRNKYLQAQQQVEEQRRQIDMMDMENNRVSEQVAVEIQRVKQQFQEKLAELSPLPDILKQTQLKLQEETQVRIMAERNSEALARELQLGKEKEQTLLCQMDKIRNEMLVFDDERNILLNKLKDAEARANETQQLCEKLKADTARAEDLANQVSKRLDEKLHEITQLMSQLETVREESARQVARTKDRCETVRRSMQGQIADLERQVAQARALAKASQKDRDELRQRMQAQINNLNESFEEAQIRIRTLQGHVNFLKSSYSTVFGGPVVEGSGMDDGCDCGNFS